MTEYFQYHDQQLYAEGVPLSHIAEQWGTPCYIYSRAALKNNWQAFNNAFSKRSHRICYAVKANSNLAILQLFAQLQSGFDIVSIGELERVLMAKGDPKKIVFSGVAKQLHEIERAIEVDIDCFNVESLEELEWLEKIAKTKNKIVRIALRINPNIDANTHRYISTGMHENKFGILYNDALSIIKTMHQRNHIKLVGIACHIGSQIIDLSIFEEVSKRIIECEDFCRKHGIILQHVNMGGGLGVKYRDEKIPSIKEYVDLICKNLNNIPAELIIEPGRSLVANTGVLLTRIVHVKHTEHKNFAIVDAGMNDLMRPMLYDAWHTILPVIKNDDQKDFYDIVGPVCESSDFLGKNRELSIKQADLLAIMSAGAYGASMSSHYNSRPHIAEIMVDRDKIHCIRQPELLTDLYRNERMLFLE